jgi:hypothetical protein
MNRFMLKPYSCSDCRHRFYALRRDITWAAVREESGRYLASFGIGRQGRRNRRELLIYLFAALLIVAMIYYVAQQRA